VELSELDLYIRWRRGKEGVERVWYTKHGGVRAFAVFVSTLMLIFMLIWSLVLLGFSFFRLCSRMLLKADGRSYRPLGGDVGDQ